MAQHFLLDGNYFETTTDLQSWSDGRVPVPQRPSPDHIWVGAQWVNGPGSATNEDVNAERDKRIMVGRDFTVSGYANTIAVSGDTTTQTNLMALGLAAQARMAQGDLTTPTPYRDENNVIHQLTPPQVFELWSVGAAFVSLVYQASWAIKDDAAGLPADIPGDSRWP